METDHPSDRAKKKQNSDNWFRCTVQTYKYKLEIYDLFVFTYAYVEYIKCALQSLVILIQKKKDVFYEMSTT